MVYSPMEVWICFFFILGCMTSNYLRYLRFSALHSSSLWTTDTNVFAKLNEPPISIKPPSKVFEINKPLDSCFIEDLQYCLVSR